VGAVVLVAAATIEYLQHDKARQLEGQEIALKHEQANILAELSGTKLLRGEIASALRLASQGTRIDMTLPSNAMKGSQSVAALAAAASQANWRLVIGDEKTRVTFATFSPDGARILTGSYDGTARIWDAATGKQMAVLWGHEDYVTFAAFSPDGSRIVTGSSDKTARIWDAATGEEMAVLRGHEDSVTFAAFSPDGSRIVTGSVDKTARIWDAATAKEIAILRGHEDYVTSAPFSPDGARIVTGSYDGTARIWDARLQTMSAKDLLSEACAHLAGLTKLRREEMRLASYPENMPEIDVCQ
jgi:Tol biopolymer transport system component